MQFLRSFFRGEANRESGRHPTWSRTWFIVLAAIWVAWFLAGPVQSQPRQEARPAPKAPAPALNTDKNFTILKIEPDAAHEEVRLTFSRPIPMEVLRENLRLMAQNGILSFEGTQTLGGTGTVAFTDNNAFNALYPAATPH